MIETGLQSILDHADVFLWSHDLQNTVSVQVPSPSGEIGEVSRMQLPYELESIEGLLYMDNSNVIEDIKKNIELGIPISVGVRIKNNKPKEKKWSRLRIIPINGDSNKVIRIHGMVEKNADSEDFGLNHCEEGIFIINNAHYFCGGNEVFESLTGYSANELRAMSIHDLLMSDSVQSMTELLQYIYSGKIGKYEFDLKHKDSSDSRVEIKLIPVQFQGKIEGVYGVIEKMPMKQSYSKEFYNTEILDMVVSKKPISAVLQKLTEIVENQFPEALCSIMLLDDSHKHLTIGSSPNLPKAFNEAMEGLKIGPLSTSCGSAAYLHKMIITEDMSIDPLWGQWNELIHRHDLRSCWSFPIYLADGQAVGVLSAFSSHAVQPDGAAIKKMEILAYLTGFVVERYQTDHKIQRLAFYDSLTNLPNRQLFKEHLTSSIQIAEKYEFKIGVMFIDIDGFKSINDTLGHAVGDDILEMLVSRMKKCLGEVAFLARIGGDEFTVVLLHIRENEELGEVAAKLLEYIRQPLYIKGFEFNISASIGITHYPDHGNDVETLMKNADLAMYHSKSQGKSRFSFYENSMSEQVHRNFLLNSDLNKALKRGEFTLYYQPRYEVHNGKIRSIEALIRWDHPIRGIVSPMEFIPMAEETGMILPLGKWVLEEACRQNKKWQELGFPKMRVAVNCSARQILQEDFMQTVTDILQETGLEARWLELEITESTLMESAEKSVQTLKQLSELGVHISIDDFGTGYSSLNYLMQFKVNTLKIDKSFIWKIPDAIIADSIIKLADSLGLRVVAEGVETVEQYKYLQSHGCHEVQGYLLSHPLPAEKLDEIFKENEYVG